MRLYIWSKDLNLYLKTRTIHCYIQYINRVDITETLEREKEEWILQFYYSSNSNSNINYAQTNRCFLSSSKSINMFANKCLQSRWRHRRSCAHTNVCSCAQTLGKWSHLLVQLIRNKYVAHSVRHSATHGWSMYSVGL